MMVTTMVRNNESVARHLVPQRDNKLADRDNCTEQNLALHDLFAAYSERVYRWSLYLGADSASAEEITQDVFFTVHKKDKWPSSEPVLSAFLFQVTRRHVANFRRSSWVKRVLKLAPTDMEMHSDFLPDEKDDAAAMRQILAGMPQKWAEVLLLHDLDGYTRAEISRILRIAEGTVASRLRFGRAAFIKKWTEDHTEDQNE